jgi:hypothetical protein
MVLTLSEVRMTATTQFGAGPAALAAAERTLLPRDILVPQAEGLAISSASRRTQVVLAIFVIGLGAILTLVWLIFLVWAAITAVTLVT